ncbi:hypothetical protein GCM10025872_35160 [Barrientosiimonas endolithica]|uniref:Lipoprotein n=1 Tax=Barrientosiimonas endolithica TaxID=1535208 RepID=A0ABM8HFS6_9MICO|nr:hypothetical protein GCM10025872_35160 [Barrientosiimonas endolithica]
MRASAGLVAASILVTASGCGSGDEVKDASTTSSVSGSVFLTWNSWNGPLEGRGCYGDGPYDDVREGAQIVIADEVGATLALGALGPGTAGMIRGQRQCRFDFSVASVPTNREFYRLKIGPRDAPQFSAAELFGGQLTLSLGETPAGSAVPPASTPTPTEPPETSADRTAKFGDSATIGAWELTVSPPTPSPEPDDYGYCPETIRTFVSVRIEWKNLSTETLTPGDTVTARALDGKWPPPYASLTLGPTGASPLDSIHGIRDRQRSAFTPSASTPD